MAKGINRRLDWPFIRAVGLGLLVTVVLSAMTNVTCSSRLETPSYGTRDCWSSEQLGNSSTGRRGDYRDDALQDFWLFLPSPDQNQAVQHCSYFKANKVGATGVSLCDTRITDWAIAFLTYCLFVVGYFTILVNEKTVRAIERPWLFIEKFLTSALLNPQEAHAPRFHVFFHNPGRTPARLTEFKGKIFAAPELTDAVVDGISLTVGPFDSAIAVVVPASSTDVEAGIEIQPIPENLIVQIQAGEQILVSRGVFTYLGPLGDRYETAFCARYDPVTNTWTGFGGAKYNFST